MALLSNYIYGYWNNIRSSVLCLTGFNIHYSDSIPWFTQLWVSLQLWSISFILSRPQGFYLFCFCVLGWPHQWYTLHIYLLSLQMKTLAENSVFLHHNLFLSKSHRYCPTLYLVVFRAVAKSESDLTFVLYRKPGFVCFFLSASRIHSLTNSHTQQVSVGCLCMRGSAWNRQRSLLSWSWHSSEGDQLATKWINKIVFWMVTHAGGKIKLRKGMGNWPHGHFNRVIGSPAVGWCLTKSLKELRDIDVWLWQHSRWREQFMGRLWTGNIPGISKGKQKGQCGEGENEQGGAWKLLRPEF